MDNKETLDVTEEQMETAIIWENKSTFVDPALDDFYHPYKTNIADFGSKLEDLIWDIQAWFMAKSIMKNAHKQKTNQMRNTVRSIKPYFLTYNNCRTFWQTNVYGDQIRTRHTVNHKEYRLSQPKHISLQDLIIE
jgi:hypothetical protein